MASNITEEDFDDRLRIEFIDDVRDRMQRMYDTLDRVAKNRLTHTEAIALLRGETHNIKGMGTAFGYPAVSLVAHRLEDYLNGLTRLSEPQIAGIHTFVDRAAELVDRGQQPELTETNQILRALPSS